VPHLLPDTFLSGYAPCLQDLALGAISSPSLPRFLSSTSDLTSLRLFGIIYSYSHCTQPETVATCLSALRKLKSLKINFVNAQPLPQRGNRASLPPTRFVLSALSELDFTGVSNYLEVLAARIEAPLLDEFHINFSHHELVFEIPQTIRLFGHLDSSRPSSLILEFVQFRSAYISFPSRHSPYPSSWIYTCQQLDLQVISVAQICSQILCLRSSVKSLNIKYECYYEPSQAIQKDEIAPTLWSQHLTLSTVCTYLPR
jgi:hypothetical protein